MYYKIETFNKECNDTCYSSVITAYLTVACSENFKLSKHCPKDWTKIIVWCIGITPNNKYRDEELINSDLTPCLVLNNN